MLRGEYPFGCCFAALRSLRLCVSAVLFLKRQTHGNQPECADRAGRDAIQPYHCPIVESIAKMARNERQQHPPEHGAGEDSRYQEERQGPVPVLAQSQYGKHREERQDSCRIGQSQQERRRGI